MDPMRTFCITGILLAIFGLLLVCHAQKSDTEGNDSDEAVAHGRQKRALPFLMSGRTTGTGSLSSMRSQHGSRSSMPSSSRSSMRSQHGSRSRTPSQHNTVTLGPRRDTGSLGRRHGSGSRTPSQSSSGSRTPSQSSSRSRTPSKSSSWSSVRSQQFPPMSLGARVLDVGVPFAMMAGANALGGAVGGIAVEAFAESRRNNGPRFSTCPQDAIINALPRQTKAIYTWNTPTVTDPDGESLPSPVRTQGPQSGSEFSEGDTDIRYEVTDRGGLQAVCAFSVTVRVNRCPDLPVALEPLHQFCDANWEFVSGSACFHMCSRGYRLVGSANVTCQEVNGELNWSNNIPECEVITCQPQSQPSHGNFDCTNGNVPGSLCSVNCDNGYQVQGVATVECLANGTWSGDMECGEIECPEPTVVANGTYNCPSGRQYPASCTLICDEGLAPWPPSHTIQCQNNGRWSRHGSCRGVSGREQA